MSPRISWELVADPKGSAEYTLGITWLVSHVLKAWVNPKWLGGEDIFTDTDTFCTLQSFPSIIISQRFVDSEVISSFKHYIPSSLGLS